MQAGEADEVGIIYFAIQVELGFFNAGVDLFEPFEEPYCRRKEQPEHQIDRVGETDATALLIGHKVNHQVGLEIADRDADVAFEDNT